MTSRGALRRFVAPAVERRSYLSVLYVLARLPIALLYVGILAAGFFGSFS